MRFERGPPQLLRVAEEPDRQDHQLRLPPVEVVVVRDEPRPLQRAYVLGAGEEAREGWREGDVADFEPPKAVGRLAFE
jgi:hypothetical protein